MGVSRGDLRAAGIGVAMGILVVVAAISFGMVTRPNPDNAQYTMPAVTSAP